MDPGFIGARDGVRAPAAPAPLNPAPTSRRDLGWCSRGLRGIYGARDRVRTGDPELGKLVLYQLSYSRLPRQFSSRSATGASHAVLRSLLVDQLREEAIDLVVTFVTFVDFVREHDLRGLGAGRWARAIRFEQRKRLGDLCYLG
jgi:hypothetical protein